MSLATFAPRLPAMEDRLPLVQEEVAHRRYLRAAQSGPARALANATGEILTAQRGDSRFSGEAKTSGVGGEQRGYDGGKKVRGRKRHLLVDTEGLILKASRSTALRYPTRTASS